jgi:hypothetical protein
MASPSWEQVAKALAGRLRNHAYCETHPGSRPDAACPFCADRSAYRLWQAKAGVQDPPPYDWPTIDIFELHRSDRATTRTETEGP